LDGKARNIIINTFDWKASIGSLRRLSALRPLQYAKGHFLLCFSLRLPGGGIMGKVLFQT
jgi:hypothetical protein